MLLPLPRERPQQVGRGAGRYLSEFDDCFGRSEPREHLHEYVRGQASELHRKSPIVWEVTHAPFRRKRQDGLPAQAGTLIVARNVFTGEMKYFLSNMAVGRAGISIQWLLWVAFSRWPIEHCFKQAKDELGMSDFEVRGWRSIHRHLYITQVSHLFCSRMPQRLVKKNDRPRVPDRGAGARGRLNLVRGPGTAASMSIA